MKLQSFGKLLPIVGGIVLVMLLVVVSKSCGTDSTRSRQLLDEVPDTPLPDADTPADTIKTLTATVSALTLGVDALHKDNSAIHDATRAMEQRVARLDHEVEAEIAAQIARLDLQNQLDTLPHVEEIQKIRDEIGVLEDQILELRRADIPLGLGYDDLSLNRPQGTNLVWSNTTISHQLAGSTTPSPTIPVTTARVTPMFTLPENATLVNSKLMTAMIGRVPKQNEVVDAMPFKVITGAVNLASNGLEIQGIRGMIWSGTAVGDWTLSCVTGRLQSATFVFEDGTIHTSNTRDTGGGELGWLSNDIGLPCIPGARRTNVSTYLAANTLSQSVSAAANAAAVAESTRHINSLGQSSSTITGDIPTFVLGKAVVGGADSIASWLADRVDQEFDAVVVPAGSLVAIHVNTEIAIDLDTEGRKINYDQALTDTNCTDLD